MVSTFWNLFEKIFAYSVQQNGEGFSSYIKKFFWFFLQFDFFCKMKKPRRVLSDNSVCKPSGLFLLYWYFFIFFLNGEEKSSYISITLFTRHFLLPLYAKPSCRQGEKILRIIFNLNKSIQSFFLVPLTAAPYFASFVGVKKFFYKRSIY